MHACGCLFTEKGRNGCRHAGDSWASIVEGTKSRPRLDTFPSHFYFFALHNLECTPPPFFVSSPPLLRLHLTTSSSFPFLISLFSTSHSDILPRPRSLGAKPCTNRKPLLHLGDGKPAVRWSPRFDTVCRIGIYASVYICMYIRTACIDWNCNGKWCLQKLLRWIRMNLSYERRPNICATCTLSALRGSARRLGLSELDKCANSFEEMNGIFDRLECK